MMWEDSAIDKETKRFLKVYDKGLELPFDIVSHMEFFYNTLLCSHSTQNPFRHPLAYPALNYPVFKDMSGAPTQTIFQFHRQLIFPERNEEMLACSESTPSKSINTSNMSRPNMDAT